MRHANTALFIQPRLIKQLTSADTDCVSCVLEISCLRDVFTVFIFIEN